MKKVRNVIFMFTVIFTLILSACAAPTPLVVVVTATPLPPTEAPLVESTQTSTPPLVTVALAGPQAGASMKWVDGSVLNYVAPSEFKMGYNGFDAPEHLVTLDGYWIYQTKVTNRMFAQCVAVGQCTDPSQELGGSVFNNPVFANHPVVGVTWDQAQGYCSWAQGRLPTEAEWEKAARGTNSNVYPWGNNDPTCDLLNFAYCSGVTSEVDTFIAGISPYGLYDMAGNVFEWVGDWYSATYYSEAPALNPAGPQSGESRVIRGSSFETGASDQIVSAVRRPAPQGYHNRDVGFRCAVPEPKPIAPYCQLAAFIPSGQPATESCALPEGVVTSQYCSGDDSYATVQLSFGAQYDVRGTQMQCTEVIENGLRLLTCLGPRSKEATNEITVCNTSCGNTADVTGLSPTCDAGYTLDPATGACNYTPIVAQLSVAGCPAGYSLADNGGQQTCVIATDANGQCSTGLYFDSLAGRCVPANGAVQTPYGIDDPSLALQTYAGCAAGYSYSDAFQCCQPVSGGTYPGCPPGSTFNSDLGACSPGLTELSGPGCVVVRVNTLKCSEPVDVCAPLTSESRCIAERISCAWDEKDGVCKLK
jgi:formylglycine-generating enzyme required for sulfatase activity